MSDIEAVIVILEEHRTHGVRALPKNNADRNLGRTRYGRFCTCGEEVPWSVLDAIEVHTRHVAESLLAAVRGTEGKHP